jgi:hypothetical protein
MTAPKKQPSSFDYLDPFRLTNLAIRLLWRVAAGVIAIAVRLVTTIILSIVARMQRLRVTRW